MLLGINISTSEYPVVSVQVGYGVVVQRRIVVRREAPGSKYMGITSDFGARADTVDVLFDPPRVNAMYEALPTE